MCVREQVMVSFTFCKVNKFFLFHQDDLALFFSFFKFYFYYPLQPDSCAASLQRQVCLYVQKEGEGTSRVTSVQKSSSGDHHTKTQMATKVEL